MGSTSENLNLSIFLYVPKYHHNPTYIIFFPLDLYNSCLTGLPDFISTLHPTLDILYSPQRKVIFYLLTVILFFLKPT